MIVLGVVLLIIGLITAIPIHAVGGRRYYY